MSVAFEVVNSKMSRVLLENLIYCIKFLENDRSFCVLKLSIHEPNKSQDFVKIMRIQTSNLNSIEIYQMTKPAVSPVTFQVINIFCCKECLQLVSSLRSGQCRCWPLMLQSQ